MIIGNPIMAGASGPAASIFVTGLSETDTVTATAPSGKAKSCKWSSRPNPALHGLPEEYQEIEYIKSDGNQYLDTNILPNANNKYVFNFGGTIENKGAGHFYGNGFGGIWTKGTDGEWSDSPTGYDTGIIGSQYADVTSSFTGGTMTAVFKSGSSEKTIERTNSISSFSHNFYAFWADTSYPKVIGKMYYLKMVVNDALVRDYIPCRRKSDLSVGMYDLVTNTFFANAGTGEFVAGPEIPQTIGGFLIKPIREFGTWTVTATDGTKTATQDVLVDVITEYEIEMDYTLWLFKNGDECIDVTGGWGNGNIGTSIDESNGSTRTKNTIDVSSISKITARCKTGSISCSWDDYWIGIGVSDVTGIHIGNATIKSVISKPSSNTEYTITLDVSSLSGNYYVIIGSYGITVPVSFYEVWAE